MTADLSASLRTTTGPDIQRKYRFRVALFLAGILVGPFTPGPTVSEIHMLELLAEVGVILLMYSIGMEFSLAELLKVKWVAIAGAPLGSRAVACVWSGTRLDVFVWGGDGALHYADLA